MTLTCRKIKTNEMKKAVTMKEFKKANMNFSTISITPHLCDNISILILAKADITLALVCHCEYNKKVSKLYSEQH